MIISSRYAVGTSFRGSLGGGHCGVIVSPGVTFKANRRRAACVVYQTLLRGRRRIEKGIIVSVKYNATILTVLTTGVGTSQMCNLSVSTITTVSTCSGTHLGHMNGLVRACYKSTSLLRHGSCSALLTGVGQGVLLRSVPACTRSLRQNNLLFIDNFCLRSVPVLVKATTTGKLRCTDRSAVSG